MSTPHEQQQLYERRSYRRPPIIEAICELRFQGDEPVWNPAMPGMLYERLRDEYPETPVQRVATGVEFEAQPAGAMNLQLPSVGVEFRDASGANVINVGPGVLSVHVRGEYPGWEIFCARILSALEHYQAVRQDVSVHRVGLRYINRLVIPSSEVTLAEYFNAPPLTPDDFPTALTSIFARFESHYDDADRDVRLLYTFASAPASEEDGSAFVLDLDVIEYWGDPVPLPDSQFLTDLKRRETMAFEAILTDRARALIDDEQ